MNLARQRTQRPALLLLLGVIGLWAACTDDPGYDKEPQGSVDSQGGAASFSDTFRDGDRDEGEDSEPDGSGEAEEGSETPLCDGGCIGDPCLTKEECRSDYCMTSENVTAFIKGADIPGGYCSRLFCAVEGVDSHCTAAMGGICFSLYPFLGPSLGKKGICLAPCETDADCRTEEDQICFDAQSLVEQGLMDASVVETYYATATKGCLPQSVADAAVAKLSAVR